MTFNGGRTFTIPSTALAACPGRILLPQHYRSDGTCLHEVRPDEQVTFRAGFLDDGIREAYNGAKAKIVEVLGGEAAATEDYLIEFESGNQLRVFRNEVSPV